MDILDKFYPKFDHVFIYDNVTTHLKQSDGALSAQKVTKFTPKAGENWLVDVI